VSCYRCVGSPEPQWEGKRSYDSIALEELDKLIRDHEVDAHTRLAAICTMLEWSDKVRKEEEDAAKEETEGGIT